MRQKMPNREDIEAFEEEVKENYRYDKLKQMPDGRLDGLEHILENRFTEFETSFPREESKMQGGNEKSFRN